MKTSFGAACAALVGMASCAPQSTNADNSLPGWTGCVTPSYAQRITQLYADAVGKQESPFGNYSQTVEAITVKDYTEQSDSANTEEGIPLARLTVTSQESFIETIEHTPGQSTFNTLGVFSGECYKIAWRWVVSKDVKFEERGIHVFTLAGNGKLANAFFEFNSVAGALDHGYTIYYPNGTQQTTL